jgi:hypothetical protein
MTLAWMLGVAPAELEVELDPEPSVSDFDWIAAELGFGGGAAE